MADITGLPIIAIRQELIDQGINLGPINLDDLDHDTFRLVATNSHTHISCTLETPHIIRIGTPSGQTKEYDLTEPNSIDKIIETITCVKITK